MPSRIADVLRMEVPLQVATLNRTLGPLAGAVPAAEGAMRRVVAIGYAVDVAIARAEQDASRSPQGRRDLVDEAATEGRTGCDAFDAATVAGYEARAATIAATLMPKPPATDLASQMRGMELRAHFTPLSSLERTALYRSLPQDARFEELRAALEAGGKTLEVIRPGELPTVVPFIDPAAVQAAPPRGWPPSKRYSVWTTATAFATLEGRRGRCRAGAATSRVRGRRKFHQHSG